jgi:hypothetical protein
MRPSTPRARCIRHSGSVSLPPRSRLQLRLSARSLSCRGGHVALLPTHVRAVCCCSQECAPSSQDLQHAKSPVRRPQAVVARALCCATWLAHQHGRLCRLVSLCWVCACVRRVAHVSMAVGRSPVRVCGRVAVQCGGSLCRCFRARVSSLVSVSSVAPRACVLLRPQVRQHMHLAVFYSTAGGAERCCASGFFGLQMPGHCLPGDPHTYV